VEMHLGAYSFIRQNYYVAAWADNFVMHLRVSDVRLWWDHIVGLDLARRYGVITKAPQLEEWGLVAGVTDPSGVLWRFAEFPPKILIEGGRRASLIAAPDIENVEYRAIGCRGPGALRDRFRQQAFELAKIADLCADIIEMMRGNPANFSARRLFRASEPQQR